MMTTLADFLGIIGVALILTTYALLQYEKISPRQPIYSAVNFSGSVFILYSLFHTWNTASVLIEVAWLLISLFGWIRALRRQRREGSQGV